MTSLFIWTSGRITIIAREMSVLHAMHAWELESSRLPLIVGVFIVRGTLYRTLPKPTTNPRSSTLHGELDVSLHWNIQLHCRKNFCQFTEKFRQLQTCRNMFRKTTEHSTATINLLNCPWINGTFSTVAYAVRLFYGTCSGKSAAGTFP